ncbi:hypothetical protein [Chitinophaga sp. S165]|uniref:hypothetical protein n=1 Tax=Chitinophaga sp. S165 TaxID=2135462 RepID=UPI000D7123ED|nr:hypothetical protein [Chitinophaga sp. S165]PWV45832.1 hypothetical protein C7475_11249 [Chitinophaga sp. S165]
MKTDNMDIVSAGPVLEDLRAIIERNDIPEHIYLSRSAVESKRNALGIIEEPMPKILELLGIRSLIVSSSYNLASLRALRIDLPDTAKEEYIWPSIRKDEVIRELQLLFRHCRTVGFDNWADIASASHVWDGLLMDVIKPIERNDLEFIFYLGDPMVKLSFLVGEALDIVSEFSLNGHVTFALDENEAINLWKILNGVSKETPLGQQTYVDLRKKYYSIFRTMNIARVLIYSTTTTMLFSEDEQLVLARKVLEHDVEVGANARLNFIEGFNIGLALKLDMPRSITLGLVTLAAQGENKSDPEKKDLIKYVQDWIDDLQRTTTINLYGE